MRLFLLLAVIFLIIALVAVLVPTQVLDEGWQAWTVAGLLAWAVDQLLGGYVVALPVRQAPPPQA